MNAAKQARLAQLLHDRRDAIADRWFEAIARTSFAPLSAQAVHQHLRGLTDQVIALLLTEALDPCQAEAIGASLVYLHYTAPEALGRTQEVLVQQLVEGLPANQVALLQPRLATLLAHLAVGFCQQSHTTILSDQEQIRLAVTSELQRLQESLRDERNFVSAILETAGALVFVLDTEGRIVRFNQACARTTGYSFDEVKGRHAWEILAIPERVEAAKDFFRRLRDGELRTDELSNRTNSPLLTRDGDRRLIALSYTGLPGNEGTIEYVISTGIDITEQSKMAKALRESEEKLRAQYKGIPIPTYTWQRVGKDFVLLDCNDAANAIVQGNMIEFIGVRASEMYRDRPGIRQDLAQCYAERTPIEREMSYKYTTTGETRQLAVKYGFVPPDLVLVHAEDVTERKQAQMQLIQADKMAAMGVMASGIAHELLNPLGIISVNAQLLQDSPPDAQVHAQCARNIHVTTRRASQIVKNLLDFARPASDAMMEIELHTVLEDSLPMLSHRLSAQQILLRKDLPSDLPHVWGNPALLRQVFTNLILNACNAMPNGGTLTITGRTNQTGQAEITFTDTGRGISQEDLPKVFDPFFTTMPPGHGTGLGLSVSSSIIQLHRGAIDVESDVGRGSTFTVRLPAMEGLKAMREKDYAKGPHPAGR
ncbi:MAG: ATP-binding protein [Anaerolineae bacterium]